jgi:osmoprotectant transport system substrate-binding protein
MRRRRPIPFGIALTAVLAISACGSSPGSGAPDAARTLEDDSITVGSFSFAESELLGELYSQTLERGGYQVRRAFGLGPREFVAPALARGLVELVPEYAGTAVQFFSAGTETAGPDVGATHETLLDVLRPHGLTALAGAPAQDANAFAVTRETAVEYGLRDLSDLAVAAPQLVFGGPPECPSRPLCLVGLEGVYGVRFKDVVSSLDAGGPVTRQALRERAIDVGLVFTTDPTIESEGLVALADDQGLQPAENVTPVVRTELLERWGPEVMRLLNGVSSQLTTAELRELNAQVASGGDAHTVVASWLDAMAGSA